MEQKKVAIEKDGVTKKVNAKDVKDYVANGWQEIKTVANPFDYSTIYNGIKK